MAFDAYAKVDGAEGESTDTGHSKWIDVESVSLGSVNSVTASRGVQSSGRGDLKPVVFTHLVDKATPKIQEFCASGQNIKQVQIAVCRQAQGKQVPFLEVKLENVKVVKAEIVGIPEAQEQQGTAVAGCLFAPKPAEVFEEVAMIPTKITWKYTGVKPDGSKSGAVESSWDQSKNAK